MLLKPFMRPLRISNLRPSLSLRRRFLSSLESGVPRCSATLRLGTKIRGQSGRLYTLDKVLQHREDLSGTIYRAIAGDRLFVLKEIAKDNFHNDVALQQGLPRSTFVRRLEDTNEEHSMIIFPYMKDDLLNLCASRQLSLRSRKRILKDALRGLAALHAENYVHTDIKPNNILVDWDPFQDKDNVVNGVQIVDVEDACRVPHGRNIVGLQVGNWMWRSPEAHAQGPVNTPSDMFSFGLVCIYTVTNRVVLAVAKSELEEGEELLSRVIARQISYFADWDGITGLLNHIRGKTWAEVFEILRDDIGDSNPRRPFSHWLWNESLGCTKEEWSDFKTLISGLTAFDPDSRLTAKEALEHSWFGDI